MITLISAVVSTITLGLGCPPVPASHPKEMPIESVAEYANQANEMCQKLKEQLPPQSKDSRICLSKIHFLSYLEQDNRAQAKFLCQVLPPLPAESKE